MAKGESASLWQQQGGNATPWISLDPVSRAEYDHRQPHARGEMAMLPQPPRPEEETRPEPEPEPEPRETEMSSPPDFSVPRRREWRIRIKIVVFALLGGSLFAFLFACGLSILAYLASDAILERFVPEVRRAFGAPPPFFQVLFSIFLTYVPEFIIVAGIAAAVDYLIRGHDKSAGKTSRALTRAIVRAGEKGAASIPEVLPKGRRPPNEPRRHPGFPNLELGPPEER
jgi:hypothetical protein